MAFTYQDSNQDWYNQMAQKQQQKHQQQVQNGGNPALMALMLLGGGLGAAKLMGKGASKGVDHSVPTKIDNSTPNESAGPTLIFDEPPIGSAHQSVKDEYLGPPQKEPEQKPLLEFDDPKPEVLSIDDYLKNKVYSYDDVRAATISGQQLNVVDFNNLKDKELISLYEDWQFAEDMVRKHNTTDEKSNAILNNFSELEKALQSRGYTSRNIEQGEMFDGSYMKALGAVEADDVADYGVVHSIGKIIYGPDGKVKHSASVFTAKPKPVPESNKLEGFIPLVDANKSIENTFSEIHQTASQNIDKYIADNPMLRFSHGDALARVEDEVRMQKETMIDAFRGFENGSRAGFVPEDMLRTSLDFAEIDSEFIYKDVIENLKRQQNKMGTMYGWKPIGPEPMVGASSPWTPKPKNDLMQFYNESLGTNVFVKHDVKKHEKGNSRESHTFILMNEDNKQLGVLSTGRYEPEDDYLGNFHISMAKIHDEFQGHGLSHYLYQALGKTMHDDRNKGYVLERGFVNPIAEAAAIKNMKYFPDGTWHEDYIDRSYGRLPNLAPLKNLQVPLEKIHPDSKPHSNYYDKFVQPVLDKEGVTDINDLPEKYKRMTIF